MSQLNGISSYCSEPNRAGVTLIEYVPTDWVNRAATEQHYSSEYALPTVVLSQGSWLTVPFLPRKKQWTETLNRSNQGEHAQINISGTTPKMRPAVNAEIMAMRGRRFLVRGTDANGQQWLLGTLEHPLQFLSDGKTDAVGGSNNYRLRFVGRQPEMAAGI